MALDHHECQRCKGIKHIHVRATTVHHINHLATHPEHALDIWVADPVTNQRMRNLIALCHDCHEAVHARGRYATDDREPLTDERWD